MNKILVLPGDGIGPSIIGSAVEVIGAVADDIELVHGEIGFSAYEASGQHLPFETLDLAGECGTTLCGPVRTVKENNGAYRNPLETLKAQLDLYAMVRRFTTFSPDIGREGMDITLWASNNQPGQDIVETRDIDGITLTKYIRSSSYSRMMARALTDMEMCGGTKVKCITREDIFPESSALFEESFTSLFEANGLEMHWIEILAAMDAQLERGEAALKDRLSKIPNGWRDYRLASKTVARVITALYATLPEKNMRHMRMLVDHGEVVIRQKRAVRSDYVQMVANDDLKQLVNRVIASECAMCLNDAIAQKHCPLREVLERTAPTEKLKPNGLCEYLDVAAEYELGEYLK